MHVRRRRTDPVFVDRTGRRRRVFLIAGLASGAALALATLVLIAGFTGTGPGRLPLLPESAGEQLRAPVATVKPPEAPRTIPSPSESAAAPRPTRTGTPAPATTTQVAPSPSKTNHRNVPTHTPGGKPTKRA
ncbi:hypothetical protein [Phytohabitans aurantiacus]|jgi:hypothetical protein|uniref:Uncharacterized protein n=1 Tax=Phytohabitans aurantiacus TaxID=3016789 RepID=A0ABQ5QLM1_9ACTN|nr:hypothetical protein [Phytohabitans aurantiacus]GLH94792.1 hypothetical protein Pa4123_00640 [Phytohabitans aurantiacus]